jgi:hypothetical protein
MPIHITPDHIQMTVFLKDAFKLKVEVASKNSKGRFNISLDYSMVFLLE